MDLDPPLAAVAGHKHGLLVLRDHDGSLAMGGGHLERGGGHCPLNEVGVGSEGEDPIVLGNTATDEQTIIFFSKLKVWWLLVSGSGSFPAQL